MHYDYRNDFPLLMQNKIIYIEMPRLHSVRNALLTPRAIFTKITTQTLCADFTL